MNAANSAVLGYKVILAPSPRKPCHSSPSSSSHGGAYRVRPVRSLTVRVIGTIGAFELVMRQNLPAPLRLVRGANGNSGASFRTLVLCSHAGNGARQLPASRAPVPGKA